MRGLAIDTTPLRESRDFRLLWGGEMISQVGSQFTVVALIVQVFQLTHSSFAVGLIGLCQLVPMLFVSIGFGPQLDRRDRRRILLVAQAGLMSASALLFLGARLGHPPLALVYGAAALSAAFLSVSMPARSAMTPRLVSPELLPQAAALNQVMWNGAAVIGPALGGAVVAVAGLTWAYGIDLLSYVAALTAAFLVHSQLPLPTAEVDETDVGMKAVFAGLRYVKGKRVLQSTFTVDIVAMVFGMPRVLFPELAHTKFHGGAGVVGLLVAAPALGAFFGAVSSGWIGRIRRLGLAILISVVVWGAAITAFGLVGGNLGLALVFLAIAGAADVISAVFRNTVQQLTVPDGLRGRISSLNIFVVAGGPRLGDFEGGAVATIFTPTISVVSGGLLCLAGVGVIAATVPQFARWRIGDPPD